VCGTDTELHVVLKILSEGKRSTCSVHMYIHMYIYVYYIYVPCIQYIYMYVCSLRRVHMTCVQGAQTCFTYTCGTGSYCIHVQHEFGNYVYTENDDAAAVHVYMYGQLL